MTDVDYVFDVRESCGRFGIVCTDMGTGSTRLVDSCLTRGEAEWRVKMLSQYSNKHIPAVVSNDAVLTLKVRCLSYAAKLPTYATDGSACFDIYAAEGTEIDAGSAQIISTGIAVEVPSGYAMLIYNRSGHAFGHDVRLSNCVGVIDSDFRGEVKVKLRSDGIRKLLVLPGMRIAQAMLVRVPRVSVVEVSELNATKRGAGGFGSTGA